jgi:hypothetical protein
MKQFCFILLLSLVIYKSYGQEEKHYHTTTSEFIFSYNNVTNPAGQQFTPGVRFSGFFNDQEQFHFNFGAHTGMFTGVGIANVGMITYPIPGVELKQRVYSLGVPVALKLGNMSKRRYLALGAEAEYFFNYKIKTFIDGHKTKSNTWFPNQVNPFNPSVFLEYKFPLFLYIRLKYYLLDFLTSEAEMKLNNGEVIPGYSQASKLFYLSFGYNFENKSKGQNVDIRN